MVFQKFDFSNYRDGVHGIVALATSKHISAAARADGGTGYTVGDLLTLVDATGGSGYLLGTIEVLAVTGGVIDATEGTGFIVRNMGAYANRGASVAIDTAGTGYQVGDIVQVQGGTFTEKAKIIVDTVGGSGDVLTASIYETGGAYTVAPGASAATIGIGNDNDGTTFAGDDALEVTLTMTTEMSPTGVAVTGGTGTGAEFDLTLTSTGWDVVHDRNDYDGAVLSNEREVILHGPIAGNEDIYLGMRTYNSGPADVVFGMKPVTFLGFNPLETDYDLQPGRIGGSGVSTTQPHCPWVEAGGTLWVRVGERSIAHGVKVVDNLSTVYMSAAFGLAIPFGPQTKNPYPAFCTGYTYAATLRPSESDAMTNLAVLASGGPAIEAQRVAQYWRAADGSTLAMGNFEDQQNTPERVVNQAIKVWPLGNIQEPSGSSAEANLNETTDNTNFRAMVLSNANLAAASGGALRPTPNTGGNLRPIYPLTIVDDFGSGSNDPSDAFARVVGEIEGCFWIPGWNDASVNNPEDTVTKDGVRYTMLPSGQLTEAYAFVGIQET